MLDGRGGSPCHGPVLQDWSVTWDVDYTTRIRADLVGLDQSVNDALTDLVVEWLDQGPPLRGERTLGGITFYEEMVAERFLLAYMADRGRNRFVLLWLRARPGAE